MNNLSDDNSHHDSHSLIDDLMKSFDQGGDQNMDCPEYLSHHSPDDNLLNPCDHSYDPDGGLPDLQEQHHIHQPCGTDPDDQHHTHLSDRTDSDEHHTHQSGFGADWFDPDHHSYHHSHSSGITRTLFSSPSDSNVHVTVGSNTGHVYLNGDDIGYIEGHSVYNVSDWNCGYWTNEGKIYDAHDNLVGWVNSADGNLYVEGKDGNCKLYHTASHSIAEGAAYLLLVWFQGQTHR